MLLRRLQDLTGSLISCCKEMKRTMPVYQVQMQRTMTQQASIEVEAVDKRQAIAMANGRRESLDWSTTDTDYEYPDIEEVA
jgi:hypothetical protein